jgi:transcription initiation factor TFIIA large subunit
MAQSTQVTKKTYNDVINKVIHNCRDAFLDEGMDEHTLQDLKKLWVEKLNASKALVDRRPPQTQPRYVYQNASGQTFTQVRPQMVHSNQPQQVQRRQQAVYLQQSSNQQGRPVQIVQNRQIQPQVGQQQVVTSQRVQIIRPGSQQQTQYVVRLTPQQQQRQQQQRQQQTPQQQQQQTPQTTTNNKQHTTNDNQKTTHHKPQTTHSTQQHGQHQLQ